jgi:hypothetical protein
LEFFYFFFELPDFKGMQWDIKKKGQGFLHKGFQSFKTAYLKKNHDFLFF